MNNTMTRIQQNLKRKQVEEKTGHNAEELIAIPFELFPEEIIRAAAHELALPDYIIDIYLFGYTAQTANAQVKKSQLQGITLTHKKLEKWMTSKDIKSVFDINNKAVLAAFIQFHVNRAESSLAVLKFIAQEVTK